MAKIAFFFDNKRRIKGDFFFLSALVRRCTQPLARDSAYPRSLSCRVLGLIKAEKEASSKKRVCQNRHILFFYRKAPTFSSQGFVMS